MHTHTHTFTFLAVTIVSVYACIACIKTMGGEGGCGINKMPLMIHDMMYNAKGLAGDKLKYDCTV